MNIRRANTGDMDKIKDLLNQVLMVHHNGRPDVFKANCRKYTDSELRSLYMTITDRYSLRMKMGKCLDMPFAS